MSEESMHQDYVKLLSERLMCNDDGIWVANGAEEVSYPDDGHDKCFMLEDNSFWFQHRNRCIISAIQAFPPAGPVMDVGGGNGYVCRGILDAGFDSFLIEPGIKGATNAKKARKIPLVISSTLLEAGFHKSSVDAAGVFDVLEHIEDSKPFVQELGDVLKPGGYLYGTVPAHQWLWSEADDRAGHFRRYTQATLQNELEDLFELVYVSYYFRALLAPIYLLRSLPYRLLNKGNRSVMSRESEHGVDGGGGSSIMNKLLRGEVLNISKKEKMTIGASIIFVARRR